MENINKQYSRAGMATSSKKKKIRALGRAPGLKVTESQERKDVRVQILNYLHPYGAFMKQAIQAQHNMVKIPIR